MKIAVAKIRELGFAWPSSETVGKRAAISGDAIDLDETLVDLRKDLAFYEREQSAMYAFQAKWNADWNDVTDNREEYATKIEELRVGIALVEAIRAKTTS